MGVLQATDYGVGIQGQLSKEPGVRPETRPWFVISQIHCAVSVSINWQTPLYEPSRVTMMTGTATGRESDLDDDSLTESEWELSDDGTATYFPGNSLMPYPGSETEAFLNSFKGKTQIGVYTERAGVGIGNPIFAWFDVSRMKDTVKKVVGTCE